MLFFVLPRPCHIWLCRAVCTTTTVASPHLCQGECVENPDCEYWEFIKTDSSTDHDCNLFDTTGTLTELQDNINSADDKNIVGPRLCPPMDLGWPTSNCENIVTPTTRNATRDMNRCLQSKIATCKWDFKNPGTCYPGCYHENYKLAPTSSSLYLEEGQRTARGCHLKCQETAGCGKWDFTLDTKKCEYTSKNYAGLTPKKNFDSTQIIHGYKQC